MRLPTGLVKHRGASLRRALVIAVVFLAGGGEGAALALLEPDPDSSGSRSPERAAAFASVTATPTRLGEATQGATRHRGGRAYYRETSSRHVAASTEASFIGLYREAARSFGVSWRLIASIHRQETAFSTEPRTYDGLNEFGCCAGPMQFNVTNGPVSTWETYRASFRQGHRPRRYPHRTRSHPSVYDDFDAMMAAGALLSDAGAGEVLDGASWSAAYAYYGHDLFGIDYANQVLARAQGWELDGFCLNCPVSDVLVGAFDAAYGAAARRQMLASDAREKQEKSRRLRAARARRKARERARRREAERNAPARPQRPRPEPEPPKTETIPAPEPAPPALPEATEPAPRPTPPAPPPAKECTKLERLLGCGGPGA